MPAYIEFVPTSFQGNFPGPEGNSFCVFKIMALMVNIYVEFIRYKCASTEPQRFVVSLKIHAGK